MIKPKVKFKLKSNLYIFHEAFKPDNEQIMSYLDFANMSI